MKTGMGIGREVSTVEKGQVASLGRYRFNTKY